MTIENHNLSNYIFKCILHLYDHQTFQVPKKEVLTYISCMDTASVRENPHRKLPKISFTGMYQAKLNTPQKSNIDTKNPHI